MDVADTGPTRAPGGIAAYKQVLAQPGITRLFVTANLARLPVAFHALTITLLMKRVAGSYTAAGLSLAGAFAIMTITSAPIGRLVDRFGQTRVLIPIAMWSCTAFAALAVTAWLDAPIWVLSVFVILSAVFPPISACQRTVLADVFDGPQRQTVFALESILQESIWTIGPLCGTLALVFGGPIAMVWTIVVLQLIGSISFAVSPLSRAKGPNLHARTGTVLRHPGIVTLVLLAGLSAASFGQFEITLAAFTTHLGNGNLAGVVMAMWAVGSATGGFIAGAVHSAASYSRRLSLLSLGCGVGFVPASFSPTIWVLAPMALVAGLGIAPLLATIYEAIGHIAPAGSETEAFSWLNVAFPIGFAVAAPIGGFLADGPGPRAAAAASGIAIALGSVLVTRRARTLDEPVTVAIT